ncbi:MAG: ATP-dependent zinc metalloprotease FtsH [Bacteroidetes bacterium]|nr:ATP-dependent zinc metalloprotease FtsH [Bacteroidota bacterium]MBU1422603.1 ATP-dependent zinc metalloprotease FtsH [Bacteroidota bacterium]MBU2636812.1 ATP-dependent zinc metalloprotease FtsH [Bacteroidota bacterium]
MNDKKRKNNFSEKKPRKDDNFNWSKVSRVLLSWFAILVGVYIVMTILKTTGTQEYEVDYTIYTSLLTEGRIKEATVKKSDFNNYTFHGILNQSQFLQTTVGKSFNVENFYTTLPYLDETVVKLWTDNGLKFTIVREDNTWVNALLGVLPWVLILGVWLFFMRRMQGGGTKGIFSFGKSKAKLLTIGQQKITFQDVAGADEAKAELQEIIEFLKEPAKFQSLGGKIPRGVLLLGPPGTGKTLLARAVAGEAGVPFFSISGADFVEMFVGVGASRVRDLFETGKKSAPCIIFIDEIDAVGRQRGAGLGGGHDEREQTLNQLLVEMDGFEQNSGVILIAATNRPDVLDPALMRPGRFDRQVVVDRPDVKGREGILKVHTRNIPLSEEVRLDVLAKGTPGLAGADLANLVNEAALLAARKNCTKVTMNHFEEAKDKVMMGTERKSLIISDEEKKVTSYHESGHVLVARMIPEADPVHKVTIIPRGRALGVTTYLPIDEKHTYSKEYLLAMITYALGGRAAEKIVFNQFTTGAGNDIERATALARKMVCEWGMSEVLGPLSYGQKDEEIFLGRDMVRTKNYSDATAVAIDSEIKAIIDSCMRRAEEIINANIEILHKLSSTLLEREILDGNEIDILLRGESLPPSVNNNDKNHTITHPDQQLPQ